MRQRTSERFSEEARAVSKVDRYQDLMRVAEQGNPIAQYLVGTYYRWGYEVGGVFFRPDRKEALKWLQQAARQGHEDAQEALKAMGESW
jgi:TPR repeat protein